MNMSVRRVVAFSAVLALALTGALAGCGGGSRVDVKGVERTVTTKLSRAYAPARVTSTTCPKSPPLKANSKFRCTTRVAGQGLGVAVTLVDTKGAISFTTTRAVVVVAHVEADLASRLHEAYDEPGDIMDITVRCSGPAARVLNVGATFRCSVIAGGTPMIEEVTVADLGGTVSYRAVS